MPAVGRPWPSDDDDDDDDDDVDDDGDDDEYMNRCWLCCWRCCRWGCYSKRRVCLQPNGNPVGLECCLAVLAPRRNAQKDFRTFLVSTALRHNSISIYCVSYISCFVGALCQRASLASQRIYGRTWRSKLKTEKSQTSAEILQRSDPFFAFPRDTSFCSEDKSMENLRCWHNISRKRQNIRETPLYCIQAMKTFEHLDKKYFSVPDNFLPTQRKYFSCLKEIFVPT